MYLLNYGLVLSLVLFSNFSFALDSSKIGWSVKERLRKDSAFLPVLVILKDQANLNQADFLDSHVAKAKFVYNGLRQTALKTQVPLIKWLKKQKIEFQRFYILNAISIDKATPMMIQELAKLKEIKKIILNPEIKNIESIPFDFTDSVPRGVELNLQSIGVQKVWDELKIKGLGIVVAGQDTGVDYTHPALKKHYRGLKDDGSFDHNYNWHDAIHKGSSTSNPCGFDSAIPCDDNAHGSHTMGTMVGDDGAGNAIGVAPEAKWIACRNMDKGIGTPARYIECFEFFLAPYPIGGDPLKDGDPTSAPNVINNSWGCPKDEGCEGGEILPVIGALTKAGVLVVASAGNDGPSCGTIMDPPAHYSEDTLSVGAVSHKDGKIAAFSSRGPSKFDGGIGPDVTAPGVGIRSSVPGGTYQGGWQWSGTSMSGPHVVGQVALLWSYRPELVGKVKETMEIIKKTSEPKQTTENCGNIPGNQIPNNTYGYGIINVYKSLTSSE